MAVFFGVFLEVVESVSGMNQGFAGNASTDQAGAASSFAFHDDGAEAELGRANGGDVTSWTGADHKNLTFFGLHH